ncbi:MAG: hypothetical protein RBU29_13935, partial [bacterium]|nr:hypothetical protein [bacterium]
MNHFSPFSQLRYLLLILLFWLGCGMVLPDTLSGAPNDPLLEAADVNGDRYSDLIFSTGSGAIAIHINQQNGSFALPQTLIPQSAPVGAILPTTITNKTKDDLLFFYPSNAAFEFKKNADLVTGALESAIQGLGAGAEAMAVGYASVPVVAMGFSGSQTIALLERSSLGWDAPTVLAAKAPVWDVRFLDLEQDGSDELLALCGMEKQSLLIYKKTTRLARLEWKLDRQIDLKLTGYRHFHAGQWNKESGLDLFLWNEG